MVEKQQAGFKFGKYRLKVTHQIAQVTLNGRAYKLMKVQTSEGDEYLSMRLYNAKGKFIKQLLVEPILAPALAWMFEQVPPSASDIEKLRIFVGDQVEIRGEVNIDKL